jgi:V/A-type H+-transporting ATPase subunit A
VHCFWGLDAARAQARFYPAIHPLQSYSRDVEALSHFWSQHGHPTWARQRQKFLALLEEQTRLERMARIIGKDALPPRQQHVLLCAELINEAFLRQSAFSEVDRYCSAERQIEMMQMISHFIRLSRNAIELEHSVESLSALPVMRKLRRMGEEIGEDDMDRFDDLRDELDEAFEQLTRSTRQETETDEG